MGWNLNVRLKWQEPAAPPEKQKHFLHLEFIYFHFHQLEISKPQAVVVMAVRSTEIWIVPITDDAVPGDISRHGFAGSWRIG